MMFTVAMISVGTEFPKSCKNYFLMVGHQCVSVIDDVTGRNGFMAIQKIKKEKKNKCEYKYKLTIICQFFISSYDNSKLPPLSVWYLQNCSKWVTPGISASKRFMHLQRGIQCIWEGLQNLKKRLFPCSISVRPGKRQTESCCRQCSLSLSLQTVKITLPGKNKYF